MILRLTNCAIGHQKNTIFINLDHIISIYPMTTNNRSFTVLYSTTKESWEVSESMETIFKLMEKS